MRQARLVIFQWLTYYNARQLPIAQLRCAAGGAAINRAHDFSSGPAVPAAQGLRADAEFAGDRRDRLARRIDERDRVPPELLGVPLRVRASHLALLPLERKPEHFLAFTAIATSLINRRRLAM